MTALQMEMLNK